MAKLYGYQQIGKELPSNVTLTDIIKTLPKEVFEIKEYMGFYAVALSVSAMAASLYAIAISPWYLLPLAWFVAGTAFTGFFVIGHDCGHRTFSKNKLWEDIVGTLLFMPLVYPFEPWRIKHNHHHNHTNKLTEDTAWCPPMAEQVAQWGPVARSFFTFFLATPLKFFASVGHQLIWHFDLSLFTEKQKPRVIVSLAAVAAFALIGWPAIIYFTGLEGFFKFWLMPWLGFHFWMSTFTVIHHTAPHIPFKSPDNWNAAQAQLGGSVHCDFPKWVEVLCHDISVHVPHHVTTGIPWYNLRKANASLQKNWGEYMTTCKWNWRMVKTIITELHVYDEKENYVPFDRDQKIGFIDLQRKFL